MFFKKQLLLAMLFALALFGAAPDHARAQGCGQQNPNCIVPTAPVGTSNNQAASTAFVQKNGGYTGLSGDCTATSLGVITCTKTNGTPFGTLAVQNANAVAITGGTITGMPNPTNASDVATKSYVDSLAGGIVVLAPSALATAAVLPNSPTYSNGTLGVGATLTAGSNTTLTVDGTAAALNTVVLVKNQASAFQNGIYSVTQLGSGSAPWILTRVTYFDQAAEMKAGSYTFVTGGTTNAGSAYTLQTSVTTVGTDPLNWLLFTQGSGSISGPGVIIATRALAATENLSAYSVVQTLGYATAGDGGGATFKNVGTSTAFKDTYVTTFSITTTGSGLTNGSYLGVTFTGGSSASCQGAAGVSGNVLNNISFSMYCSGYKVGDVLTIPTSFIGGSGVAPTVTVTAISTPQASFTDAAGTHFQYVADQPGHANILQFGAKGDWNGTDGTATNNYPAMWSAGAWANNQYTAVISGAGGGGQIVFPAGGYMFCGSWQGGQFGAPIPQYTRFSGVATGATLLVECAANTSNLFPFALCDSSSFFGQYGCKIENMTLNSQQVTTNTAGVAMIYSNSGQQFVLGENLEIQPGLRGCIKYEIGKGGASNDIWLGIDCEQKSGAGNPGFSFNASSTQHILKNSVFGASGSGAGTAISVFNGRLIADGLEIEDVGVGLLMNSSTSGNVSVYKNVQQSSNDCISAILLQSGNLPGNLLMENVITSCPITITNGQSGGTNFTGNIVKQITCVSGACS